MTLEDKIKTRIENKPVITEQAEVILNHRYLLKDTENKVVETPTEMFTRVAKAVALVDKQYMKLDVESNLTELLLDDNDVVPITHPPIVPPASAVIEPCIVTSPALSR